jgi:hypothetical protein
LVLHHRSLLEPSHSTPALLSTPLPWPGVIIGQIVFIRFEMRQIDCL